ncbi:2-hydroxychromene-2-carboxylate isomerase [Nitrospirillum viridazoti]|uniref:2-hydroxychromene-2-carboxylate isomerase n=1 Tax=Nitrospirillum viridazoti CBAmc TaxID=1441467 RepID=A0A248JNS2_9PROT|nr:2-hydroxychromene-2-carboxylate isomerase [Nitrospirillum amazonense]ASG20140.1 2-hydroxychromene-2-carboxylate isomerase [Nitrospirillum amazonense CBAmc]TWB36151.1 2-hydroxychromene-2-carboxylate isomerase [Nitrospirillum amazonense]
MAAQPLDFYFDFASPYGYFAAMAIDELAARHGRTVAWHPILLGAVFKSTGVTATVLRPLQGDYLRHDVMRSARYYGLPLVWPQVMPINAVASSRAYYWTAARDIGLARSLAKALYRAHWQEGRDISGVDVVADVATGIGMDADSLKAGMQEPAVKDALRVATDAAMARGVFGSPFIFVDGEGFWGADRLVQVERWLAQGGW